MAAGGEAAAAARRGEVMLDVGEDGAGQVPRAIRLAPDLLRVEVPADVDDAEVGGADLRGQPVRRDDRRQPLNGLSFFL